MSRRLVLFLTVLALGASSCAADDPLPAPPTANADDADPADDAQPEPEADTEPGADPLPAEPPPLRAIGVSASAEFIADGCWQDGQTRCGAVYFPQSAVDSRLVWHGVTEWNGDHPGDPVVIVGDSLPVLIDATALGRGPVIQISYRRAFNSGPSYECPLALTSDDPEPHEARAAGAACAQWLRDLGIDPATASPHGGAYDVLNVLGGLGVERYDLVVYAGQAGTVEYLANADGPALDQLIYIDPIDPRESVSEILEGRTMRTLEASWEACAAADPCDPPVSLDGFFDLVDGLDDDPLAHPYFEYDSWDATAVYRALFDLASETVQPSDFINLAEAIAERDADTVDDVLWTWTDDQSLIGQCGLLVTPPTTRIGASIDAVEEFLRPFCEGAGLTELHRYGAPVPGDVVLHTLTSSAEQVAPWTTDVVVLENRVGMASAACIEATIIEHLDRGRGDAAACAGEPTFLDPDAPLEFVEAILDATDWNDEIRSVVPSTWEHDGYGWQGAEGRVGWLYLQFTTWDDLDVKQTIEEEFIYGDVFETSRETRTIGGYEWTIAIGEWSPDDDYLYAVAARATETGTVTATLDGDRGRVEESIETVLVPAIEALEIG